MGRSLDILRGKVDVAPGVAPWATAQRSVVNATGGASMVNTSALGIQLGKLEGSKGWQGNVTAARCIDTISTNLASVDLTVMVGDEANDAHEVAQLWNVSKPGAPVSARITRQVAFAGAEVRGESFTYLDRGPTGLAPCRGTWPIYDEVDVVVEDDPENPHSQRVKGYIVRKGNQRLGLLPSEVLWLRYPHPTKAWGALAPWAAATGAAELDSYARAWQLGEFRNGAKPGSVIYLGNLDQQGYDRALAAFKTEVAGPQNAGKSLLVAGAVPATVSRLSMTAEEMAYLKSRTANRDEVMLAFGIRPDYFAGQSTYENQRAAKTGLWSDLLLGKLDVLGSEVDRQLLPAANEEAAFDVSKVDALQENQDAIYGRIRGIAYTDVITMDESRAQLGLEPLPGGEGAYTLTEYRARVALRNLPPEQGGDPSARMHNALRAVHRPETVTAVLPRRGRYVAMRGAVVPVRTAAVRKAKKLRRPSTSAFYQTHEQVGQRAMAALADKQLRVVLRNLSKLRTSQVADWTTHRAHATDLAADNGVVPAGLIDGMRVSPFTTLPMTNTCACERGAADDLFDSKHWASQTEEATDAWLRGVWEGAGAQMADGLGVDFDSFDDKVLRAMEARRSELAELVTGTTKRVLDSQLLAITAEEGWSIDQAEQAIRGVFDDLSGYRAQTIARTEVVGGYNRASNIAAMASGVVTGRRWLTAEDEAVRPSHQRLNGQRLTDPKDRYSNGLLHPGDTSGPASETVNCRCVETYDLD
jgi:HK97 family phage portal protein